VSALPDERTYIANAVAALEAPAMTPGEARAKSLAAARRVNVYLDAGEPDTAREQLAEAKRLRKLADELERK
jgi:hypothetical protein